MVAGGAQAAPRVRHRPGLRPAGAGRARATRRRRCCAGRLAAGVAGRGGGQHDALRRATGPARSGGSPTWSPIGVDAEPARAAARRRVRDDRAGRRSVARQALLARDAPDLPGTGCCSAPRNPSTRRGIR